MARNIAVTACIDSCAALLSALTVLAEHGPAEHRQYGAFLSSPK